MGLGESEKKRFILVHGACHGAWCWYKLKPLIEATGHRATVLDLAASGINPKPIQEIRTLYDYSRPLMETMAAVPAGERVILVGHSLGGLSAAAAMEAHPDNIAAAVFVAAFVPDTTHAPSYVLDKKSEKEKIEDMLDNEFSSFGSTKDEPFTSFLFGPKFLSTYLYQLSPIEDLELAKTLVRPSSDFREDLAKADKFSEEKFGSVTKVYVVCSEDKGIRKEFQEWMIQNSGIQSQNVMEIEGADHMPMFSKPHQLLQCLLKVARQYA